MTVPEARPFRAAFPLDRGSGEPRGLLVPSEAVARSLPRVVPGRSDVTEPILVPKLRIHLADFPYLHSARPRGCSPWRPDAEFGTHRHGRVLRRSPGFSRSARLPRDPAESTGLWRFHDAPVSLPPRGAIRGIGGASARTDNSAFRATVGFPGSRRLAARDLSVARHVDVPPPAARKRRGERPVTGFPNRYGIPSRLWFARRQSKFPPSSRAPEFSFGLGPTHPCAKAVHTEPFPSSILQVPARAPATTTKICTDVGSGRAHAQTLPRTTPRPSYSPRPELVVRPQADPSSSRRRGIGPILERHPFSEPLASAGESLHTPTRMPTSMATVPLSLASNAFPGIGSVSSWAP